MVILCPVVIRPGLEVSSTEGFGSSQMLLSLESRLHMPHQRTAHEIRAETYSEKEEGHLVKQRRV